MDLVPDPSSVRRAPLVNITQTFAPQVEAAPIGTEVPGVHTDPRRTLMKLSAMRLILVLLRVTISVQGSRIATHSLRRHFRRHLPQKHHHAVISPQIGSACHLSPPPYPRLLLLSSSAWEERRTCPVHVVRVSVLTWPAMSHGHASAASTCTRKISAKMFP